MFLRCVAIKVALFNGCGNIRLISLLSVAVTYMDYHSQSHRRAVNSFCYVLGPAVINEVFCSRFKFK